MDEIDKVAEELDFESGPETENLKALELAPRSDPGMKILKALELVPG